MSNRQTMAFEGKIFAKKLTNETSLVAPTIGELGDTGGYTRIINWKDATFALNWTELDVTLDKHNGSKAYQRGMQDFVVSMYIASVREAGSSNYVPDVDLMLEALWNRHTVLRIAYFYDVAFDNNDKPVWTSDGIVGDFTLFTAEPQGGMDNEIGWNINIKPATEGWGVKKCLSLGTMPSLLGSNIIAPSGLSVAGSGTILNKGVVNA